MSTPTPGPWRVTDMKHTVGRAVWAGSGTDEYRVCGVGLSHVPGRMEANAALIAAAPALLSALKDVSEALAARLGTNADEWLLVNRARAICDGLTDAPPPAVQEPYAWTVNGTRRMWFGKYAENDARIEAKHCGGSCEAYPLYRAPIEHAAWVDGSKKSTLPIYRGDE